MELQIIAARERPELLDRAADYFASKWGVRRELYYDSILHSLDTPSTLPRWYLMMRGEEIIGSYGLIANDFNSRQDLWPWLCALYIEEHERGHALGSKLLEHARREAARLGFPKLYLATDHIGYYERYGWSYLAQCYSPWDDSRVYEIDSIGGEAMNITQRRYSLFADFDRVYRFLQETYDPVTLNSYLLPHYWEYAHHHSHFDYISTARMGLWECGGSIVAIAAYEMELGEIHLHTRRGYEHLLPELLSWSEQELYESKDGRRSLNVWITDKEPNKRELLVTNGYSRVDEATYPIKIFRYENPFSERKLPDGFSIISGIDADPEKVGNAFYEGFDHGTLTDELRQGQINGELQMFGAPHASPELMTVVVAPNSEYACVLGMWYDEVNRYAYLEPLATVPKYRRMGLATVALIAAMRKTKELGATYCFGGGMEFYTAIGFEHIGDRELYHKEWEAK